MGKDDAGCGPKWGWSRMGKHAPPWARGGPFSMGFGGGGPERGQRLFGQGDLRLLLLALIADQPSHGYDLIRTIEARFGGAYSPSPGAIYPTLTLLEEQDLAAAESGAGGRKSYAATQAGREFLVANATQVRELMERIGKMAAAKSASPLPESIAQAVALMRQAIMAKSWDATEAARVAAIVRKAVSEIISGETK